jgi:hypothetical protein
MTRRTAALALTAVLLAAAAGALHPGCARRSPGESPLEPGGVLAAGSVPGPGARATGPAAARPTPLSGGDRLEAVRTVKQFCDLVGSRRRGQALDLLCAPGILRAHELHLARELAFVSASVKAHPRTGTLTVAASVRVSPPQAGVGTLFFTLGRVGTTTGGWLITAVTTSP